MNDDGAMMRLPELLAFAAQHGLKLGTVSDLIAYRRRFERLVTRVAAAPFGSFYGDNFTIYVYRNKIDGGEHVALVKDAITPGVSTLVRVHQEDFTTDMLGWAAGRRDYVPRALRAISAHPGPGVAVFVRDPNPASISLRVNGGRKEYHDTHAYRDYGIGAQILLDLGVTEMILLTSSALKLSSLEGFGLSVVGRMAIPE